MVPLASFALFSTGLFAGSMEHSMGAHPMKGASHQAMNGDHGKMDMKPATLGTYKKSVFWTKGKHMKLKAPLVPVTPGIARFEVQVLGKSGELLEDAKLSNARYEMPGMKMDLPEVSVRSVRPGVFQLVFPVPMAGFWKVHMSVRSQGMDEKGTLKFVTK